MFMTAHFYGFGLQKVGAVADYSLQINVIMFMKCSFLWILLQKVGAVPENRFQSNSHNHSFLLIGILNQVQKNSLIFLLYWKSDVL